MNFKKAEKALLDEIKYRITGPKRRVIAVDIDGTLAEYKGWKGYRHVGKPIKSVVEAVRKEYADNSEIIIHTCRITAMDGQIIPEALAALTAWLKKNDIPYDEIWTGVGKPYASSYWDDKAVRMP